MEPVRRRILKIYIISLTVGAGSWLWLKATGIGIPCMVNSATGLLCPGCGTSRMFLSLLRLDIPAAFRCNSCVFLLLVYWNVTAMLCFAGKPAFVRSRRFLYGSLWMSVAVLAVFGILRNII